jgi:hypothetical protein
MSRRQLFLSSAKAAPATAFGALGFRTAAHAQSPTAVQFPDSTVLPTPTPPFKGFIEPNLVDSQPGWPPSGGMMVGERRVGAEARVVDQNQQHVRRANGRPAKHNAPGAEPKSAAFCAAQTSNGGQRPRTRSKIDPNRA